MRTVAELALGDEPSAAPRSRRFVLSSLAGENPDLVDDVALVANELVTNAVLHGEAPATLRLSHQPGHVRVEVTDSGRTLPVRVRQDSEVMTGRGLSLVAALSSAWGVEPREQGKLVWAELSLERSRSDQPAAPEVDLDELLATWPDADGIPTYPVSLGSVPTDLLLSAKAYIDNVVRELVLVKLEEARSGNTLPPAMAALVKAVTTDFAEARTEMKRQALLAARRGEILTDVSIRLPLSAADAGERYLAALEEADRYARSARILTLAPPRSHQLFRRWYVTTIVGQLRALALGANPPPAQPLPQLFAEEVDRLVSMEVSHERLRMLQQVTAELTGLHSVDELAATVVNKAGDFLGVETARVYLLTTDQTLRSVAWLGPLSTDTELYDEIPLDSDVPGAAVARTGEPLFLRSLAEIYERFPVLEGRYPSERSLHVVPLTIGTNTFGLLALTFVGNEREETEQRSFVRALADALAQAIERTQAMHRAEAANDRLSFLAEASVALSESLDFAATLEAVCQRVAPRLADWCVVQLRRGDALETVAVRHADPAHLERFLSLAERYPVNLGVQRGGPVVSRTGVSEIYPTVPAELLEGAARDPEHLAILREFGMRSVMIVPLTGRSGTFGAITLIQAESGRRYDANDLPFVEDLARRAALALETADTFREQSGRLAEVTRVAEAAQRAILAPPPARIGPVALAARYVSAAAEARVGGDFYEVVERPDAVRLLIGDVRGKGLAAVRTATIVLGEFRAAAGDLHDLGDVVRQIDRRVRPHLGDEDFVTAVVAEITTGGACSILSCGHPQPLLVSRDTIAAVPVQPDLPLGLGAEPAAWSGRLSAGDRLLLYTDGIVEARNRHGQFVDLAAVVDPVRTSGLTEALDDVLGVLRKATGAELGDDLALLLAEFRP